MNKRLKKDQEQKDGDFQDLNEFSALWIVTPPARSWMSMVSFWLFLGVGVIAAIIALGFIFQSHLPLQFRSSLVSVFTPAAEAVSITVPTPVAITKSTPTPPMGVPTPQATGFLPTPPITGGGSVSHPLPTPLSGGSAIGLTPAAQVVGWASSLDGQSHFNEPNIHVGFFNGHVYYGAIQFDLSDVPSASRISYAALEIVGLGNQNLGQGGAWQVRMLKPDIDETWPGLRYDRLHEAEVQISILPGLTSASLAPERVNVFPFGPEQIIALEQHLGDEVVSFRIDGPNTGSDNLFTWDSGFSGQQELQIKIEQDEEFRDQFTDEEWARLSRKPILWIVTSHSEYVAITPSPTPENIFTVAAIAATVTSEAEKFGTATPLPVDWATPIIVTVPPPPGNEATAQYQAQQITAEAKAYGTATATPLNVWTATPTPNKVFVTSTPTPENVVTEAALAAQATYVAQNVGTYTPVPTEWATPFVTTPQPAPHNGATAEFYNQEATAEAFLYGMVWTATPTSLFSTPTPVGTYTPTPGYETVPQVLVGKIAFLSDRAGSKEETGLEPMVYVMDADGSNVTLLSGRAVYDTALARDSFSADQRFRAYVEDFLRFDGRRVPGIYFQDYYYDATEQLTRFGAGIAWMPAWSPTREQIALVSNDSQDDEIWIINRDGSGLLQLTVSNAEYNAQNIGKDDFIPEVSRHPSWSPDGNQIIFWSNRTGNAQIWIANSDGSNQRIINHNSYNDWNPVWIKYTDTPPLLPEATPTRGNPFDIYR